MQEFWKTIRERAAVCGRTFGPMTALPLVVCLGAAPALAGGLSVGLGGLGEVSVGRGSLAEADLDVGGLDVEASVADGGSLARGCVGNCDGGGTSVGVSVGGGGVSASLGTGGGTGTPGSGTGGTGTGGTGTGGTGTGGTGTAGPGTGAPGTPGVATAGVTQDAMTPLDQPRTRRRAMACAGSGNSGVYDGFALVDRNGQPIGQVHDTRLSPDLKIMGIRVKTVRNLCVGLEGGSYTVAEDGRIWVNMDGARFR